LFELNSPDGTLRKVDCAEPGGEGDPVGGLERTEGGREESNMPVFSPTLWPSDMLSLLSVASLDSGVVLRVLASESLELRHFSGDCAIPGRALGLGLGDREYLL
jgi:hypothetical protein